MRPAPMEYVTCVCARIAWNSYRCLHNWGQLASSVEHAKKIVCALRTKIIGRDFCMSSAGIFCMSSADWVDGSGWSGTIKGDDFLTSYQHELQPSNLLEHSLPGTILTGWFTQNELTRSTYDLILWFVRKVTESPNEVDMHTHINK